MDLPRTRRRRDDHAPGRDAPGRDDDDAFRREENGSAPRASKARPWWGARRRRRRRPLPPLLLVVVVWSVSVSSSLSRREGRRLTPPTCRETRLSRKDFSRKELASLRGGAGSSEELYEAYDELQELSKAYEKEIHSPAVVVVGAQSSGKSALVEALMGFQFNEVGGGTRTRRPIALRMKYAADADEPRCFVDDERFAQSKHAPATLRDVQAFVRSENQRLERDSHRAFEPKDIHVRIEYRFCPNFVLIDTPGLLAYHDRADDDASSVLSASWKRQAVEALELALEKCKVKEHVLLCVEDSNDWSVDSVARKLCRRADPTGRRTILVNTKLDTKLLQFSRKKDVADFLAAKALTETTARLLAGPFFTSVPAGRVRGVDDSRDDGAEDDDSRDDSDDDETLLFDFGSDAEYRAAVERAASADASLIASRLGRTAATSYDDRLGVSSLRLFLESYVDAAYRSNVAKVLPELDAERAKVTRRLREARQELEHLSPRRLKRSAESVADKFCRSLSAAVAGAVSAPPTQFGEHLADERVAAGAFLKLDDDRDPAVSSSSRHHPPRESKKGNANKKKKVPAGGFQVKTVQADLDRSVGHAEARLYGGAQYRRTLREFALAVRRSSPPVVTRDEIANALGVGDAHDGADFVRAACVIAVEKARRSFEPQLDALALRVSHVMRRLPPAVVYMMNHRAADEGLSSSSKTDSSAEHVFLEVVTREYDAYAVKAAEKASGRCRDDLAAMTRFVTWDLAAAQTDAIAAVKTHLNLEDRAAVRLVEATAGPDDAVTPEERDVVSEWKRATLETDDDHTFHPPSSSLGAGEASDLMDQDVATIESTSELVDDLTSAAAEEIHNSESSLHAAVMVEHLVKRIAAAWREHFARTVAVKFNCFFLMPFVDDFPLALRDKIDDLFESNRQGGFDVDSARSALQARVSRLETELRANTKLHHKFQRIQRSLGISSSSSSSSTGTSDDDDDEFLRDDDDHTRGRR